jgi:entericidin B
MIRNFLLALAALAALAGCNAMQGLGQDVSAGGDAISDTADDVEDDM